MDKLIITENTEFIYWDNFDYQINDSILVSNNAKKYRSSDELLKICRPVFTIHYKKGIFMLDYLFWIDNINICDIDYKVKNNTFQDIDFERSVKTYFVDHLRCFTCGKVYKGALSVDPAMVYPNNFGLRDKKLKMINEEDKTIRCHQCGNSFTSKVLHVF
ncbi:hypothetical protein ABE425_06460 [Chryseobacterium cucumeris]|uniref:hypothetical protein n=1 Tax=Chryseobacterium cucumeris TaxID=1813611 RepID=UPI003207D5EF